MVLFTNNINILKLECFIGFEMKERVFKRNIPETPSIYYHKGVEYLLEVLQKP